MISFLRQKWLRKCRFPHEGMLPADSPGCCGFHQAAGVTLVETVQA